MPNRCLIRRIAFSVLAVLAGGAALVPAPACAQSYGPYGGPSWAGYPGPRAYGYGWVPPGAGGYYTAYPRPFPRGPVAIYAPPPVIYAPSPYAMPAYLPPTRAVPMPAPRRRVRVRPVARHSAAPCACIPAAVNVPAPAVAPEPLQGD